MLTDSQKKILETIIREDGASRATLVEEGATSRGIDSLVEQKYIRRSALNVYTLTELGQKTCQELRYDARVSTVVPTDVRGECIRQDAEEAAEIDAEIDAAIAAEPRTRAPKPSEPLTPCLCGCGAQVKSRFVAGHDARLHGQVLRAKKENAQLVVTESAAGWLLGKAWAVDGYRVGSL
jgi:DNA-binding MarR family transcriptional regulator